jgi:hypothetical protein
VTRLVEFYVTEHNQRIPHAAFDGQTPNEIYFGRGDRVPDELTVRDPVASMMEDVTERRATVDGTRSEDCRPGGSPPAGGALPSELAKFFSPTLSPADQVISGV